MDPGKTSRFMRATVIAGIGAFVTVLLSVLIGLSLLQPGQPPSTLARRVEGGRTVFFLRTTDFSTAKNALSSRMKNAPGIDGAFTALHGFELAILDNGSGSDLSWTMEGRPGFEQSDSSIRDLQGTADERTHPATGSSAVTGDPGLSLASASFFRLHAPPLSDSGTAIAYMQLKNIPSVYDLSEQPAARALLNPFTDAILTWTPGRSTEETEGTLWLKPRSPLQNTTAGFMDEGDTVTEASGVLLALHMNHPGQLIAAFDERLTEEDAGFAEGFRGILRIVLRRLTGRTAIEQAASDLLTEPAYLRIGTTAGGIHPFLFSGGARSPAILDEWVSAIAAAATPGIARSIPLSNGDRRMDVTAGEISAAEQRPDGWTIRTIAGTSSPFTIATRQSAYVLSNHRPWLDTFITIDRKDLPGTKPESGFVDIGPARAFFSETFPFLSAMFTTPLPPALQDGRLQWSVRTTPGSVAIGWLWKK